MIVPFLRNIDIGIVLLLQSYLLPSESETCVVVCKTLRVRFRELSYELTLGYPLEIIVRDAGKMYTNFDLDFQLKNRNRWDDLVKEYRAKSALLCR